MDQEKTLVAKRRWRLLGQMLSRGRCNIQSNDSSISVRRFASFGLLQTKVLPKDVQKCPENGLIDNNLWYEYTSSHFPEYECYIRHLSGTITIQDILGFNNTGNVCVWPAEEVLTYYALQRKDMFKGKSIIELGGGMTCLSGIALAQLTEAKEILLTDGNEQSVENVKEIIERNQPSFGETSVSTRVLLWDEYNNLGHLENAFDMVIMADCLFFDEYREDLVNVLQRLLKPKGEVLSFAPRRGETFKIFMDMAQSHFTTKTEEKYDDFVWSLHEENLQKGKEAYDDNIHYPMLLQMWKKETS